LLLKGAGVGARPTEGRNRLRFVVKVVFPLAQSAFDQAEAAGGLGAVVTEFGKREGTGNGALAGAVFDRAACLGARSIRGVVHDGPDHVQMPLEEVFAG